MFRRFHRLFPDNSRTLLRRCVARIDVLFLGLGYRPFPLSFFLQCRRHADISTVANITRKAEIRDKKRVKSDSAVGRKKKRDQLVTVLCTYVRASAWCKLDRCNENVTRATSGRAEEEGARRKKTGGLSSVRTDRDSDKNKNIYIAKRRERA